ncbi:hypothetical protein QFC24_004472 [Naganishia onofrii]|uniref:Uncharacterized protein n=1 Tax=Naganishia onofrii TaxID=1851511 RepID=A0ACC2XET6_9TREE|nr:hypothetical protein QFC24_004472 [Naganishia onofrii]
MPPEPRTSTRNKRPTAVPSGSVAAAARLAATTAGQDSYLPEPPSGLQAGRSSPLNTLAGDSERQGTTGLGAAAAQESATPSVSAEIQQQTLASALAASIVSRPPESQVTLNEALARLARLEELDAERTQALEEERRGRELAEARVVVAWAQGLRDSLLYVEAVPAWQTMDKDRRDNLMAEFSRRVRGVPSVKALFYHGDKSNPDEAHSIYVEDWIFKNMMQVVMNDITYVLFDRLRRNI